jgi:hypothetical protein
MSEPSIREKIDTKMDEWLTALRLQKPNADRLHEELVALTRQAPLKKGGANV